MGNRTGKCTLVENGRADAVEVVVQDARGRVRVRLCLKPAETVDVECKRPTDTITIKTLSGQPLASLPGGRFRTFRLRGHSPRPPPSP